MIYAGEILVASKEMKRMNKILTSEEAITEYGEDSTIETYTINFKVPNRKIEADIKVCNGDGPYVDAVLFDDGSEVGILDARDVLNGTYQFEYNGDTFVVDVVSA